MKFLYLFIFFGFYGNLTAQTYHFDQLVTIQLIGKSGNFISEEQRLFNTKDDDYFIRFCSNSLLEIYDENQNFFHVFEFIKGKENDLFYFKYLYSCENPVSMDKIEKEMRSKDFRVKKINEKEYILGKYRNEKAKRPEIQYQIVLEESDHNQLHYLGHIKPYFYDLLLGNLDASKKYIIKKMTFFPNGKEAKTIIIKEFSESELVLKLPNTLNFDCN